MASVFPIPSINFIPKFYQQGDNAGRDSFCDKLDSQLEDLENDLKDLKNQKDPARAKVDGLLAFGDWLAANIKSYDSERQRRVKIYYAVQRIKYRSTFDESIKIIIDNVCGGDSSLVTTNIIGGGLITDVDPTTGQKFYVVDGSDFLIDSLLSSITLTGSAQWVVGGDGVSIPSASDWGSVGGDGIDDDLGLDLLGEGTEIEIAGNIYINVDNDSLTLAQIEQLDIEVLDECPAYYRLFLGYLDSFGNFVTYTVINPV